MGVVYETTHGDGGNGGYDPEFDEWFLVSGDMDDFIFYGEPYIDHSEK